MFRKRTVVGPKIETTIGTAVTPGASDVICPTYNADLKILEDKVKVPAQGSIRQGKTIPGPQHTELSYMTYIAGKGSSGAPSWANWLKACGMSLSTATFTTTQTVADWKAFSVSQWIDGLVKKMRGGMANAVITLKAGAAGEIAWNWMGGYVEVPAAEALVTGTYDDVRAPRFGGTGSSTIGGRTDLLIGQAVIDLGNNVNLREDPNSTGGYLCGYIGEVTPTLKIDPETLAPATYNFFTQWNAGTELDVSFVLNGGANNTVTLTLNDCEPVEPVDQSGDRNGRLVDALGFDIHGDISIAFT